MTCRIVLSVVVVGSMASCAGSSGSGDAAPKPSERAAPAAESAPRPPAPQTPCQEAEAEYLELRAKANACERHDDCAEIWPGPCPHGPYYANVATDTAPIDAAVTKMREVCEQAECEMPQPLGIASCEAGRCVRGRAAPVETEHESCWDTRVTYLDPGHQVLGDAFEHLTGPTPLHAVGVPREGVMRVSAMLGCEGCELRISEHNSGMASLVESKPFTPSPRDPGEIRPVPSRAPPVMGRTVNVEIPVRPGVYYLATLGASGSVSYEMSLLDAAGAPMEPDRRGVVHLRTCEG